MKNIIFKVIIDNYEQRQLEKVIKKTVANGEKFSKLPVCIATINPEILLKAKRDSSYRKILNNFNLRIIDGFGIVLCSFLLGRGVKHRFTGVDLAEIILAEAIHNDLKISFVLNENGLSSKKDLLSFLKNKFGKNKLRNCEIFSSKKKERGSAKIKKDTQILFVGLGAPEQEVLIQEIKDKLPKLRVAIGIGGTFDYWTNSIKRAPRVIRILGMEWLWRLLTLRGYSKKKNRVKRIFGAVFIFPLKYIFDTTR